MIKGGPQLRARLDAVLHVPDAFRSAWAYDALSRMRPKTPVRTGRGQRSLVVKEGRRGAGVYGAFWLIFVDRGTKAHDIEAKRGKALRFEKGGQTIFARKVHLRRKARRPFITEAAQNALKDGPFAPMVIDSWNARRLTRRGKLSGARRF